MPCLTPVHSSVYVRAYIVYVHACVCVVYECVHAGHACMWHVCVCVYMCVCLMCVRVCGCRMEVKDRKAGTRIRDSFQQVEFCLLPSHFFFPGPHPIAFSLRHRGRELGSCFPKWTRFTNSTTNSLSKKRTTRFFFLFGRFPHFPPNLGHRLTHMSNSSSRKPVIYGTAAVV